MSVVIDRVAPGWPSHADLVGLLAASGWPPVAPRSELIVYGDFNCPFSLLASQRVDQLARTGLVVEWRAVERARNLPSHGRSSGADLPKRQKKLAEAGALAQPGESLPAKPPLMINNTAAAVDIYAAVPPGDRPAVRDCLFAALWTQGRRLSEAAEIRRMLRERDLWVPAAGSGRGLVRQWRADWLALPRPVVPAIVRPQDGTVVIGANALAYLAGLLRGTVHRPRPA